MSGGFTKFAQTVRDLDVEPAYPEPVGAFDLEEILPLQLIREHTKTDDNITVTDQLLAIYRAAAFESCERYTGQIWVSSRVIRESISQARGFRQNRRLSSLRLDFPSVDGRLYVYGGGMTGSVLIRVAPGKRSVKIPILQVALDASSCCRPDALGAENFGLMVMYRAGVIDLSEIPAGIKQGCLKYIAWSVMNPGDVMKTVMDSGRTASNGITGTNDGAWASGAVELWRMYLNEAL